jgi:hypothetical protein
MPSLDEPFRGLIIKKPIRAAIMRTIGTPLTASN